MKLNKRGWSFIPAARFGTGLLCLLASFMLSCSPAEKAPLAVKGSVDLSSCAFTEHSTVPLNGEWEFYWRHLYAPSDFEKGISPADESEFIPVPGLWNGWKIHGKGIGYVGYATLRLKVQLPSNIRIYGLRIPDMFSAYTLWINGVQVSKNGSVGTSLQSSHPQYLPTTVIWSADSPSMDIVLQISNFHDAIGGMRSPIVIGHDSDIVRSQSSRLMSDVFMMGILLFMGLYHLAFYSFHRKERASLLFSAFVMIIAFRTLAVGNERLLIYLFPDFDWETAVKIEILTVFLSPPVFLAYMKELFPDDVNRWVSRGYLLFGGLLGVLTLSTPARVFTLFNKYALFVLSFACLYMLFVLGKALWKRREGSLFFIIGFAGLLISIGNDILIERRIATTPFLLSYGVLWFLVFQSFSLPLRFARAYSRIEDLSKELSATNMKIDEYSRTLEYRVEERTALIVRQNQELELQMTMAREMQSSLLPPVIPQFSRGAVSFRYRPMFNVGGDFVDFITSSPQGLGVFICDVSGHGVSAALLASMMKMALNRWVYFINQPSALLEDVHRSLCGKMGSHFVTASACYIDFETGELLTARAGHPSPVLLHADGRVEEMFSKGRLLCENIPPGCDTWSGTLGAGDKLVLYTDGLVEARNGEGSFLGFDGFIDVLRDCSKLPVQEMCDGIVEKIIRYSDGAIEDDITLVVIERRV